LEHFVGDELEACMLWQVLPDESVRVFVRSPVIGNFESTIIGKGKSTYFGKVKSTP
jgi:hypothetical protein